MPLVINDRVLETSTSTGTGAFTLGGAVQDYVSFSTGIGANNTTYYTIVNPNTGEWETGLGTLNSPVTTLTRTTVYRSSTGGTAVSFTSGTKLVFCDYLADRAVYENADGVLQIGATGTAFSVPNTVAVFYSSVNGYSDVNAQNASSGTSASTDYVATANNGTDTTNFIDMGINSSLYADAAFSVVGPNDGYLYVQGSATGGDLAIGTAFPAHAIKFFQDGTTAADEVARFTPTTNNFLVGTTVDGGSKITAAGIIETNGVSGGIKFPDGTIQTSANNNFRPVLNGIPIGQVLPGTSTLSPVQSFNYTFSDANALTTSNISIVPSARTSVTLPPISTGTVVGLTGTITFSAPHNLAAGNTITISQATPAGWNGTWVVAFTNPTVVTITFVTAPTGNYASGATVTTTSNSFGPVFGGDELEMDGIMAAASCTTAGTINVYVMAANNAFMAGNRTFNYSIT
jgi:hypothetical protein